MELRVCQECGDALTGRRDQKFCSDHCRNYHNNRKNEDASAHMRRVNNILRKNRRILMEFIQKGIQTVNGMNLIDEGFNFHYFTNTYRNRHGVDYFFCYDHGYIRMENDEYVLVKKSEFVR
jgi:predicted nucleic acid-binding Zn ribbon protein